MLFFMCYTLASSGAAYPATFRPGKRFIVTSAGLEMPNGGKSLTIIFLKNIAYARAEKLTQVPPVLIARVLRPVKLVHIMALQLSKRLKVANDTSWLTPKAYSSPL